MRHTACTTLARLARGLPPFRGKSRLFRSLIARLAGNAAHPSPAEISVRFPDGLTLHLDARDRSQSAAAFNGHLERDDIDFLAGCALPNSTVIDIGANIGLITVPLLHALRRRDLPNLCVLAVEPVPANADRLRKNLAANGLSSACQICQCALGESEGEIVLTRESIAGSPNGNAIMGLPGQQALATAAPNGARHSALRTTVQTHVPLHTLVNLLPSHAPPVSIVKIDVEGAELAVLKGALPLLLRDRPIVYGEFHPGYLSLFGSSFADVGALLEPHGYLGFAFKSRLHLTQVPFTPGRGNATLCPLEKIHLLQSHCRIDLTPSRNG